MKIQQQVQAQRISIRGREPIARGLRRSFNNASKQAWEATADYFHENLRDQRFTPEHAREAGYYARKGQNQARGSKAFRRSYFGRKFYSQYGGGRNQANPLEYTGETRRAVSQANISSTRHAARISYPGARKLNYRNPRSRIRMNEEFRRITASEINLLARVYDQELDERWGKNGA